MVTLKITCDTQSLNFIRCKKYTRIALSSKLLKKDVIDSHLPLVEDDILAARRKLK